MARNPPADAGHAERFMLARLQEELKRLNNPASDKIRKLFLDYAGVDVTKHWICPNYDAVPAKKKLDELLGIRVADNADIRHLSSTRFSLGGGPKSARGPRCIAKTAFRVTLVTGDFIGKYHNADAL